MENITDKEEKRKLAKFQKETMDGFFSPDFCQQDRSQWYVMRVTYGRADKAVAHINSMALEDKKNRENESVPYFAYTPHETKFVFKNGKRTKQYVACVPGFIFFYGSEQDAFRFTHRSEDAQALPFMNFAYDHTTKNSSGKDIIMTIPCHEMLNFMRLAEIETTKAYSVSAEECHFRKGGKVRIIHGAFEGIVGRVARVHSQTRVVVTLEGIISYATAYIPAAFMVPAEE